MKPPVAGTRFPVGRVPPGIKHMNSNLKTTKETLAILRCADSTFHSHLEKQAIKPIRVGTRSFFTLEHIEILKNSIDNNPTQTDLDESGEGIAGFGRDPDKEQHSRELTEAREEIEMLSMQVNQWQRQAQIYQDLYQELLNNQQPQEEKKPDKAPEKKVSEKRWWDISFRRVI